MVRRRTLIEDEGETEINLSSMIDCIFILLIFFIVTTVFVEEGGFQVNKPDAAAISLTEDREKVVLEISENDEISMDGMNVSLAEIPGRVKAIVTNEETPVVIRAHEKSTQQAFVSVWDAARLGGAKALSFSTVN